MFNISIKFFFFSTRLLYCRTFIYEGRRHMVWVCDEDIAGVRSCKPFCLPRYSKRKVWQSWGLHSSKLDLDLWCNFFWICHGFFSGSTMQYLLDRQWIFFGSTKEFFSDWPRKYSRSTKDFFLDRLRIFSGSTMDFFLGQPWIYFWIHHEIFSGSTIEFFLDWPWNFSEIYHGFYLDQPWNFVWIHWSKNYLYLFLILNDLLLIDLRFIYYLYLKNK